MKFKIGYLLMTFMLVSSLSYAVPLDVQFDAGKGGYTGTIFDADTLTDPWDEISIRADTGTTQFDDDGNGLDVGDTFKDSGHAKWISYNFLPGFNDSEGLDQSGGYDVTIEWSDVTGYISQESGTDPINQNTIYTGGIFDFYFDPTGDTDFGATTNPANDSGFESGGGGEIHFMTIGNLSGTGTNTFDVNSTGGLEFSQGASQFRGQVTSLSAGYLTEYPSGLDLNTYVNLNFLFGELNQNTQSDGIIQTNTGQQDELFTVYSRHDGSMSFDVVPEPSTLLLFGTGLLGLAGLGRRKFFKKG